MLLAHQNRQRLKIGTKGLLMGTAVRERRVKGKGGGGCHSIAPLLLYSPLCT